MQIAKDESGQILRIVGTLGIAVAEEFHNGLRDFIDEAQQPVVDLSEVGECDATALQILCSAQKTAEGAGKPFGLTGVSTEILDASRALGLQLPEGAAKRGDEYGV